MIYIADTCMISDGVSISWQTIVDFAQIKIPPPLPLVVSALHDFKTRDLEQRITYCRIHPGLSYGDDVGIEIDSRYF